MLESAIAQLRLGISVAFGRPINVASFERIVAAMKKTVDEFGFIGAGAAELLNGPSLDPETMQQVQLSRFRQQAAIAARGTPYYADLFARLALDPTRLTMDEIRQIPLTPKDALRDDPDAFLNRAAQPWMRAMTTGTTGWPTSVYFSADEVRLLAAVTASHVLLRQNVRVDDIAQIYLSSRALIAVSSVMGCCAYIGVPVHLAGLVSPAHALALLSERRSVPGKRERVSVIDAYPSYIGELVEEGLRAGYRPDDFGLRHIVVGGEILTAGLRRRAQRLFGPVTFQETYGMTETLPMGATECSAGHWHYETTAGLLELIGLDGQQSVAPGEPGSIVGTPFPPYRETTILLRYDTEDVVSPLPGPLDCELKDLKATSRILGKRRMSVRHDAGWTFPRQLQEALEAVEQVPLPARFSCWPGAGGVEVEVVARSTGADCRRVIGEALEAKGVPVRRLVIVTDRSHLRHPNRLRCDLREHTFTGGLPTVDIGNSLVTPIRGRAS